MSFLEILLIGIGLSMYAVAVYMSNGMVYKNLTKDKFIAMPIFFGVFQGLMPVIGFYAGSIFSDFISKYSGIITFIVLGIIGSKMIKDGFGSPDDEEVVPKNLTYKVLFLQAIATSIDAFAVGVSFCAVGANILVAAPIIAITTLICSLLAIYIGKKFGNMLENKAQILGGIILVLIGIKALL